MKRLFVGAALLPLAHAAGAQAEVKISTATTTPVATSTVAAGQPDSILIEPAGTITLSAPGAAVTMDAVRNVTHNGGINFNGVNDATGIRLVGGAGGDLTGSGSIALVEDFTPTDADNDGDLDGAFAQGSGRFGIRATGPAPFTGTIALAGGITVEGNDSAAISLETVLTGSLVTAGPVAVSGDRIRGIAAGSIGGDVRVRGSVTAIGADATAISLGDVAGGVFLQNTIVATGYRSTTRLTDAAARAKLDADDLKQGGPAVRIAGNVGGGIFLERPPADTDTAKPDEDNDGLPDAGEATAVLNAFGAAPALDIGATDRATTIGAVGTGDLAFGLVNRGTIAANGVNDGVSATAVRIGQPAGGTVAVAGGIHNQGATIAAQAFGAEATGLLLAAAADVPTLKNSGTISATQSGAQHDARAVLDQSGRLALIENSGTISAVVGGGTGAGRAVAIDLSANTAGAVVRQAKVDATDAPRVAGEVRFGSGADRLELLGGTLTGAMSFGAGADALVIDGAAAATGQLSDSDGRLSVDVRNGRLALTNAGAVALTSLKLAADGVLGLRIDPAAGSGGRLEVSGVATLAAGAKVEIALSSLVDGPQSFQVIKAGTLQVGAAGATLAGAPFLYQATLRADQPANALFVDLRPKTAAELGLNRAQGQAYGAVLDALDRNESIESAILAQTTQAAFGSLYQQLLPDHSGGSLMSAAAISTAVSAAAGQPLRIDRDSATAVWLQEVQFQVERDAVDAAGYRSRGFGLAGGMDMLGERNALGLGASFVTTDYRDRGALPDERVSMNVLGGSGYWRLEAGAFQANARAGLGFAWFDGARILAAQNTELRADAKWTGWIAEAHAGASYDLGVGWLHVRPAVAIDYVRLSEGGYTEKGGGAGFDLKVDDRQGDLLTGEALLTIGARFGDESYVSPEVTVGYRSRLAGSPGRTTARFEGGQEFTLDPEQPFDGGAVARVGLRGGSQKVLYLIDGGGTFDSDYSQYDIRAMVRFQF